MLTKKQVEKICEAIKAKVSRETGIERERVDSILDQKSDPKAGEWRKIKKVMNQLFKV